MKKRSARSGCTAANVALLNPSRCVEVFRSAFVATRSSVFRAIEVMWHLARVRICFYNALLVVGVVPSTYKKRVCELVGGE